MFSAVSSHLSHDFPVDKTDLLKAKIDNGLKVQK
jgi:hypothetical protein